MAIESIDYEVGMMQFSYYLKLHFLHDRLAYLATKNFSTGFGFSPLTLQSAILHKANHYDLVVLTLVTDFMYIFDEPAVRPNYMYYISLTLRKSCTRDPGFLCQIQIKRYTDDPVQPKLYIVFHFRQKYAYFTSTYRRLIIKSNTVPRCDVLLKYQLVTKYVCSVSTIMCGHDNLEIV